MNSGLQIDNRFIRIDAHCQVVQYHLFEVFLNLFYVVLLGFGCQGMKVGNNKEALVLILQTNSVNECSHIMPQVHLPCGPVSGKYSLFQCTYPVHRE